MFTKDTNKSEVAIEFSRKRKHKHSTSGMFDRLFTWTYKKARQSKQSVVRIQSVLYADALSVCRIQLWFENRRCKDLPSKTKQAISSKNSVNLVCRRIACLEKSCGLKIVVVEV